MSDKQGIEQNVQALMREHGMSEGVARFAVKIEEVRRMLSVSLVDSISAYQNVLDAIKHAEKRE